MERYTFKNRSRSFLRGMARAFDMFGVMQDKRDFPRSSIESDIEALRSDWDAVGNDIRKAMCNNDKEE